MLQQVDLAPYVLTGFMILVTVHALCFVKPVVIPRKQEWYDTAPRNCPTQPVNEEDDLEFRSYNEDDIDHPRIIEIVPEWGKEPKLEREPKRQPAIYETSKTYYRNKSNQTGSETAEE